MTDKRLLGRCKESQTEAFDKTGHLHIWKALMPRKTCTTWWFIGQLDCDLIGPTFIQPDQSQVWCSAKGTTVADFVQHRHRLHNEEIFGYRYASIPTSTRFCKIMNSLSFSLRKCSLPKRSHAIIIQKGVLVTGSLRLVDGSEIVGIKPNHRIKYLNWSFESELIYENTCIRKLKNKPQQPADVTTSQAWSKSERYKSMYSRHWSTHSKLLQWTKSHYASQSRWYAVQSKKKLSVCLCEWMTIYFTLTERFVVWVSLELHGRLKRLYRKLFK